MNHKKSLLIVLTLVAAIAGFICFRVSQKENSVDPEEYLEHIVNAAEDVLDGDIQQISKTELIATFVYGHETESDNTSIFGQNCLNVNCTQFTFRQSLIAFPFFQISFGCQRSCYIIPVNYATLLTISPFCFCFNYLSTAHP